MSPLARSGPQSDTTRLCHDLRQYVAAGLLAADMPGDDCLDEAVRRRLDTLRGLFAGMQELIAGQLGELRPVTWVDLVDLVAACVPVVELSHAVTVQVHGHGPVQTQGDPVLVRRALSNVLDNAARASGPGGAVQVTVHAQGGLSVVQVEDEGLGFGHVIPGTGQGMSIVDMALRACHGRLEIASGPGAGTTVRLLFPGQDGAHR